MQLGPPPPSPSSSLVERLLEEQGAGRSIRPLGATRGRNSLAESESSKLPVAGSIPAVRSILFQGSSAAERLTVNQDVGGSIPPPGAIRP